jgi:hypothetical protein
MNLKKKLLNKYLFSFYSNKIIINKFKRLLIIKNVYLFFFKGQNNC